MESAVATNFPTSLLFFLPPKKKKKDIQKNFLSISKFYCNTLPSLIYALSGAAYPPQWQSWLDAMEMLWPQNISYLALHQRGA